MSEFRTGMMIGGLLGFWGGISTMSFLVCALRDRVARPRNGGMLLARSRNYGRVAWIVVAVGLLLAFGLVGSDDLASSADLTSEVDRAEVMAWAR